MLYITDLPEQKNLGSPCQTLIQAVARVSIAHDRRGHGRSSQTFEGHEMDTYAADVAELASHLDLRDAIHVGHSTGGGEVKDRR